MDHRFDPHLPLDKARSLPSEWYVNQKAFEAELAHVFRKEWIWVGRAEELSKHGTWMTAQVGKESVVVTRDFEEIFTPFRTCVAIEQLKSVGLLAVRALDFVVSTMVGPTT